MANEIIKVYDTETNALANSATGRIDPTDAIANHEGIIANVSGEAAPYYIYKKFYYRIEANEPVSEFHIDWDDGEDNSTEKSNIEIIKLEFPQMSTVTSHIYTEHKHFFPLIRVKSAEGFLSKWYTNDGYQTDGSGTLLNDYTGIESSALSSGQNEFSLISVEKTNTDRINSFNPSNLPPIGVLKVDKKRIYSGIDNTVITGYKPLLYAYSTSTASTKPDIKFTLQDSKGAIKEHTIAGTYIWNAGSAWVSEAINYDTTTSNTYNAVPAGNYHTVNQEQWRLTALDAIDGGADADNVAKVDWSGSNNYYLDIFYDGGTLNADNAGNTGIRIYFNDGVTTGALTAGRDPSGSPNGTSSMSAAQIDISGGLGGGTLSADSILNDFIVGIAALNNASGANMGIPITVGAVTVSGQDRYIDITRTGYGATSDSVVGGISSSHMTFTKQRDGTPTIVLTEFAKKLLRVELDNATELADTDRVFIKIFDTDSDNNGTISDDALITNKTVAVLSNGNPIVEIEDSNTIYLDGTESFTRASNLSISSYNFDEDKLNNSGAVQATDSDAASDLMSGTFSTTGTKEISYTFDNNGNSLDLNSRIYSSYRLPRLQVKDNMTDRTDSSAVDALTYSTIEHFAYDEYTTSSKKIPSDLEVRNLIMFSNHATDNTADWHDVDSRNLNDTQEIMGSPSSSSDGTYVFQDSTNITDHPKNHLLLARIEKFDRVFFRMNNNNDIADTMPTVAITAYYGNGTTWEPLEIIDETQGLKTSGSIKFNMPHDWKKGVYTDIDSGAWVGPVPPEDSGTDVSNRWNTGNFPSGAYGLLISFTVLNASSRNRLLRCMNVWPYNNSHSQLIKIEDPHHVSLNDIVIAQSISFGRNSKLISIEDKFGKSDIRKIGASGGKITFGSIDLGNSVDDRKTIVGYQKDGIPVYLDIEHKSGEKTRFFGVISQVTEDYPTGTMYPKWAVTMSVSHILELSSAGAITSDNISIGGSLVDDGKYLL